MSKLSMRIQSVKVHNYIFYFETCIFFSLPCNLVTTPTASLTALKPIEESTNIAAASSYDEDKTDKTNDMFLYCSHSFFTLVYLTYNFPLITYIFFTYPYTLISHTCIFLLRICFFAHAYLFITYTFFYLLYTNFI